MHGSDFLSLDPATAPSRGRTAWLAAELRAAIRSGSLQQGVRLPASRELSADLGFSRGTVVEAYRRLAEEGLLKPNRGGGTTVSGWASPPHRDVPSRDARAERPSMRLNISEGAPDLSAFPRAAWLRAERRVLANATSRELGYADPQGTPRLRAALAGWLARSRGVEVGPERIIITSGATGALSLLGQVLREHGIAECAVEDPGADGVRRILDYWLDALHPALVDAEGIDTEALARLSPEVRAVFVTPAHQFPSGVVLSPDRRHDLVAWAERVDGFVIEDDYDSEYRYDRAPMRSLHASAPERVVHLSSLSKVLAPALRIGWMIAPKSLHADLVHKRWATDLGSPALPQLALAELIESGALERHLRTLRRRHRERRDAAAAAIARHLPGCRIEGVAAGLHLVVMLPRGFDDARVAARAADEGVLVLPLSALRTRPGDPGLVIGYGPLPPAQLEKAIETLGRVCGLSARSGQP